MEQTRRQQWPGKTLWLLVLVPTILGSVAKAETRNATTALGVRVERHTAVYLPSPEDAAVAASFRTGRESQRPRALGNGEARLTVSSDGPQGLARTARGGALARVVVTAFEP